MRANATLARHGRRARPRPGQRHRLHRRRGRRQQRLRDDRGHHPQLLPHGGLADLRPADAARSSTRRTRTPTSSWRTPNRRLCDGPAGAQGARSRRTQELMARIRAKYEIKNTNGYRLDAFLDGATPVEILRGLMVGSEGTFGFISEVVFDTLPLDRHISTALLFFPSLPAAAAAVPAVQRGGRAGRGADGRQHPARLGERRRACPPTGRGCPKATAALLVEFRAPDEAAPARRTKQAAAKVVDGPRTGRAGGLGDQRLHPRRRRRSAATGRRARRS